MKIYFTTCNPKIYKLNENWDDGNRQILWGYGRTLGGKFKGSEVGDCVLVMLNDTAHNNDGDTLYHCVIEDGIEKFETLDDYKNNTIDGKYVLNVNDVHLLKFYKLRMLGKTDKIKKQSIIETQNENCPILTWAEVSKRWCYSQSTKCLTNRNYLKCDFSKLLLECKEELNLTDDEIALLGVVND